jgi:CubicO group peptidase (beta-lactamase class C family)
VQPEALKTMRPGTGWGMDFSVVMDAAAAGEPFSNGAYYWWGIFGTWFWIDPVADFTFIGMMQHQNTRTSTEIHGLSRNLVYQAILDFDPDRGK